MSYRRIPYIVLILIMPITVFGQKNITVRASAPKVVEVGEYFYLKYEINEKPDQIDAPRFDYFSFNGPSMSHNMSTQIINGKMTRNNSYIYTYTMAGQKEGKFTFEPAVVKIKGKSYRSNPIHIEVLKNASVNNNRQRTNDPQRTGVSISPEDLFVEIDVDKTSIYKGESLLATIKIFTRVNLSGFQGMKLPSYKGFWAQEIETPGQVQLERTNYRGKIYNVGIIKKSLLFPQQSGEIVIEPFELDVSVRSRGNSNSFYDDFFGNYKTISKKLKSNAVKIQVKNLPDPPSDFKGAVGEFNIQSSISHQSIKANEALNYKIRISGKGNIKLLDALDIEFPPDFEVYDPKISENLKATDGGLEGSKSFEYVIIPRHSGTYTIPDVNLKYFSVRNKKYISKKANGFSVEVSKGDNPDQGSMQVANYSKEELKTLGRDIRYIKTDISRLQPLNNLLLNNRTVYLLFIIPLVLFLLLWAVLNARKKQNADASLLKNKKASKMAGKRLKKASIYLKEKSDESFLTEILQAIWGYLSDKLYIPQAELSKDNVKDILINRDVSNDLIDDLLALIEETEFGRYAPSGKEDRNTEIYDKSMLIISRLEQSIKTKKKH